jgi:hypothetical protein
MKFDELRKVEKEFAEYLKKFPQIDSTKIQTNENKEWALWIIYKKGLSIADKREIATELGDVPLKWQLI